MSTNPAVDRKLGQLRVWNIVVGLILAAQAAVVGSGYFAFHTLILDGFLWPALYRQWITDKCDNKGNRSIGRLAPGVCMLVQIIYLFTPA
jgi:hypothetical protein